ncbi:MAG: MFS transporter [Saprospiraceae bacterium]|nr:MFS transporter [Saprospiraceae bacterium]
MRYLTRTIWVLSIISLLTDTASEMLYPIMPIYLKSVGFSIMLIGILEGIAEATAGLSKGYFGKLSDVSGRRVPFVQLGYTLSAISKPMMALFVFPLWIFLSRTMDRIGKGLRTGARDALLSDESTAATKGRVFGFHRSMDTIGAVLGPVIALIYLYYYPQDYKTLFLIAFIPGLLAICATFYLKDNRHQHSATDLKISFFSFLKYWKSSPAAYRQLVVGLLCFTLFNSSDVFLLLKAKESGLNDTVVIGIYIFYNLIYALFAFPVGILADKIGLKSIFIVGLFLFSVVYFGMALPFTSPFFYMGLFFLYGIYASATEGISKAWISVITDRKETATAIGTYAGLQSICTMFASTITGFIWYQYSATAAFIVTGSVTLIVIIYFLTLPYVKENQA